MATFDNPMALYNLNATNEIELYKMVIPKTREAMVQDERQHLVRGHVSMLQSGKRIEVQDGRPQSQFFSQPTMKAYKFLA